MDPRTLLDWPDIYKRLTLFAYQRLDQQDPERAARAQDLAAEAISRFFDDSYAGWDPQVHPSLLIYLGSVINGLLINERRLQRRHQEATPELELLSSRDPIKTPEQHALRREQLNIALTTLHARLKDDPLSSAILEKWIARGLERPQELAKALNVTTTEIRNANRRLKNHIEIVRDELSSTPALSSDAPAARQP